MSPTKLKSIVKAMKYGNFTYPKGKATIDHFQGLYYLSKGKHLVAIMGPRFLTSLRSKVTKKHK